MISMIIKTVSVLICGDGGKINRAIFFFQTIILLLNLTNHTQLNNFNKIQTSYDKIPSTRNRCLQLNKHE